jgi:hypothetical protein
MYALVIYERVLYGYGWNVTDVYARVVGNGGGVFFLDSIVNVWSDK